VTWACRSSLSARRETTVFSASERRHRSRGRTSSSGLLETSNELRHGYFGGGGWERGSLD